MGVNHPGEMDILADIVQPQYGLITNIGTAHIEFFGSAANIAAEKKKIFKNFTGKETGFLYEGDEFYQFLSEDVRGQIVPFGPKATEGYGGSCDLGLDGMSINWEGLQIHFPLFGRHNVLNALGAMTLSRKIGAHREAVKKGLEGVKPIFARSQVIRGRVTVIEDCYNANPDSMTTVLRFFDTLPWDGRKIAVLGNMLELGSESRDAHSGIARLALKISVEKCFFFGEQWEEVKSVFHRCISEDRCFWTQDFDTLLQAVIAAVQPGDLVVLKGSRGAELERLVDPLLKAAA
jgi:UDP-N-acetylmuramoyl-tripeptide--D-alanyl-D-alanine ligase